MTWKATMVLAAGAGVVMLSIAAMRDPDIEGIIRERVINVTARCQDGMYSTSRHDRGTCARHGGVAHWYVED